MSVEADIKDFLAREVGLTLDSLDRLATRSHSPNWRGVCADGRRVVVKLVPAKVRLVQVPDPRTPQDLFPGRELRWGDRRMYVLDWKDGAVKYLDELTPAEVADLVAAHAAFCRCLGTGMIHGDFNCNNLLFAQGKVSGVLDLEAVRAGHPCEDWVRYVLTGVEHLPVFASRRRRRTIEQFARLVSQTPYSVADWRRAIDAFAAAKRSRKMRRGRASLFVRLNLAWRERFYGKLIDRLLQRGGEYGKG